MLKQSLRIEQVLGFYGVELQRVGRHQLRGLCPLPTHDSQRSRLSFSVDTGFRKSQVVFNLHRAVRQGAGCAVVVEGFFDCLRVHQAGYPNVVALMGVSLSDVQEQLLRERFPKLVLMLDGDEAGRRASQHLAARLRGNVSLSVVEVPSGRQPDQLSSEEMESLLFEASVAPGA